MIPPPISVATVSHNESRPLPESSAHWLLDEPLLFWFFDGFWVVGADDGRVRRLCRGLAAALGLVGVVGAFVTEHVADQEHQGAQDGEDHHRDDACAGGRTSRDK